MDLEIHILSIVNLKITLIDLNKSWFYINMAKMFDLNVQIQLIPETVTLHHIKSYDT